MLASIPGSRIHRRTLCTSHKAFVSSLHSLLPVRQTAATASLHAQPHYSTRSPPASLGAPFSHGGLEVHEGSKLGAIIGLTSFVSCLVCGCSAFGNTFFHIFLAHSGGCRQEASSSTVTLSPLGVEVSLSFIFCPSVSSSLPLSTCSYLTLFPPSAFSPPLLPASLSLPTISCHGFSFMTRGPSTVSFALSGENCLAPVCSRGSPLTPLRSSTCACFSSSVDSDEMLGKRQRRQWVLSQLSWDATQIKHYPN